MGIQSKLFVAFFSCSLVIVAAMYGFMQWSGDQGLLIYLNKRDIAKQERMAEVLSGYYATNNSWDFIRRNHRLWRQLNESLDLLDGEIEPRQASGNGRPAHFGGPDDSSFESPPSFPPSGQRPPGPRDDLPTRIILLDESKESVFGSLDDGHYYAYVPIYHGGNVVGWLTAPPYKQITDDFNLSFVEAQNNYFLVACGILILFSAFISIPLSARLVKPVQELARASHRLASGNFSIRIDDERKDELGQLIKDFK